MAFHDAGESLQSKGIPASNSFPLWLGKDFSSSGSVGQQWIFLEETPLAAGPRPLQPFLPGGPHPHLSFAVMTGMSSLSPRPHGLSPSRRQCCYCFTNLASSHKHLPWAGVFSRATPGLHEQTPCSPPSLEEAASQGLVCKSMPYC